MGNRVPRSGVNDPDWDGLCRMGVPKLVALRWQLASRAGSEHSGPRPGQRKTERCGVGQGSQEKEPRIQACPKPEPDALAKLPDSLPRHLVNPTFAGYPCGRLITTIHLFSIWSAFYG